MSGAHPYGKGVDGFDRTFGLPMRQFVPTLLRLARLRPGQRVLDVATGTGIAAEAALDLVGPSGYVAAVDDTPAMLDRARARLGGRPNVSFAAGRAGSLPFPDESFDAALCGMALMIFPDRAGARAGGVPPRAAGRRARRGLRQHRAGAVADRPGPRSRRAARAVHAGRACPPLLA